MVYYSYKPGDDGWTYRVLGAIVCSCSGLLLIVAVAIVVAGAVSGVISIFRDARVLAYVAVWAVAVAILALIERGVHKISRKTQEGSKAADETTVADWLIDWRAKNGAMDVAIMVYIIVAGAISGVLFAVFEEKYCLPSIAIGLFGLFILILINFSMPRRKQDEQEQTDDPTGDTFHKGSPMGGGEL